MESFLQIFLLTTLGSLAGLVGGVLFLYNQTLGKILSSNSIPFATGVILGVTFFDLFPESVEGIGNTAFGVVLIVLISAFLFEEVVAHLHHHADGEEDLTAPLSLVVVGDTIHNFMDGVVIAASYLFNPSLGLVVAVATFLHEVPHEVGDFGLMLKGGWSKLRIILVNLASALSTYLGALLVLLFSSSIQENLSVLLAGAAGLFLYIGATDLLPRVHQSKGNAFKKAALVTVGIILMWLVGRLK